MAKDLITLFTEEKLGTYYVPFKVEERTVLDEETGRPRVDTETGKPIKIKKKIAATGALVNHYNFLIWKHKKLKRVGKALQCDEEDNVGDIVTSLEELSMSLPGVSKFSNVKHLDISFTSF